ncbi:MAG: class I SAM-dependent methyltransferase [Candidatus Eisenbacteria bacterium]|uniref:Class I SAM-dependent methyltransferase n=1 Tax=Eiseniibacteriota bacterium TaxID=2212470 RepID=A0A9D6LC27_UNCEI|nr:class I SAM-dependent methyltransferase [Candidatus Eisenbacteria bacterium]MBI3539954.1 class I SAM-dependent methyltransferase [Candidatus Eisenbacteria bacterium]
MSAWRAITRGVPSRGSVWRYRWLIHERVIAALERARPHAHGVLLDIGCGARPFERLFRGCVTRYLGADLAASLYLGAVPPDVFARAEALPIRAATIDTVLGLSMMDHIAEPARVLDEAHRVLRSGGTLILEFPQLVPLHDPPHDYFRYTRSGVEWLASRAAFETIEIVPIGSLMARVGLDLTEALNRLNRGPTRVLTELPVRALYVFLQVLFAALDRLCFDPRQVVGHLLVARRVERTPAASGY